MIELKNKTVIVTGSSRGLGKRVALEFSKCGANVVVNYNSNAEEAESVVQQIRLGGGNAIAVKADVSHCDGAETLYESTFQSFGKVDVLVNNAGTMITKFLQDFSEDEFDRQFSINVKGVFLMMRLAAENLEPKGRIINISSTTSRLMMPSYAVYSATKAAVEQMTRVFAKEIGAKGITVNSVLPGPMNTELFLKDKPQELIDKIAGLTAFGRIGEVQDIIPIILFLASDESQWITGQSFGVNGGMA